MPDPADRFALEPRMRTPIFTERCARPWVVRTFTIFKLLILASLIVALILSLPDDPPLVDPPSLTGLPTYEVLTWSLIEGRGTVGSRVEVQHNQQLLGTVDVGEDGRWQLLLPAPLPPGTHLLTARAVDNDGQTIAEGPQGRGQLIVVGLPTLNVSVETEEEDRANLTLSGNGTPATILRVVHNQQLLAPAIVVDGAGLWATSLWVARPSENNFSVEILARDNSVLGQSAPVNLNIPAGRSEQAANLVLKSVGFDNPIRVEPSDSVGGWLVVDGSGQPGREIAIYHEGQVIGGPTAVQPDGRWRLSFAISLSPGDQTFAARMIATDSALEEEQTFIVLIPAPPVLTLTGGATDMDDILLHGTARAGQPISLTINSQALTITPPLQADDQGSWQYQMRLSPGEYAILALDGSLASDQAVLTVALAVPIILGQATDGSGQLIPGFYGRGRPFTRLELLQDNIAVGQALVTADGYWRCRCTLPPGERTLTVREIDEPHRASPPATMQVANPSPPFVPGPAAADTPPFRCPEASPPGQIQGHIYIIGCGESMRIITHRLGVTPEQLLAYNPQLSNPPRFYFGQIINIPQEAACFDDPD